MHATSVGGEGIYEMSRHEEAELKSFDEPCASHRQSWEVKIPMQVNNEALQTRLADKHR